MSGHFPAHYRPSTATRLDSRHASSSSLVKKKSQVNYNEPFDLARILPPACEHSSPDSEQPQTHSGAQPMEPAYPYTQLAYASVHNGVLGGCMPSAHHCTQCPAYFAHDACLHTSTARCVHVERTAARPASPTAHVIHCHNHVPYPMDELMPRGVGNETTLSTRRHAPWRDANQEHPTDSDEPVL